MSPEERAHMIDEYHQEELQQTTFEEGKRTGELLRQQEIARALLQKGVSVHNYCRDNRIISGRAYRNTAVRDEGGDTKTKL
jgi:hypothetical protein